MCINKIMLAGVAQLNDGRRQQCGFHKSVCLSLQTVVAARLLDCV